MQPAPPRTPPPLVKGPVHASATAMAPPACPWPKTAAPPVRWPACARLRPRRTTPPLRRPTSPADSTVAPFCTSLEPGRKLGIARGYGDEALLAAHEPAFDGGERHVTGRCHFGQLHA